MKSLEIIGHCTRSSFFFFFLLKVRRIRMFFSLKPSAPQGNHPSKFLLIRVGCFGGDIKQTYSQTNKLNDFLLLQRIDFILFFINYYYYDCLYFFLSIIWPFRPLIPPLWSNDMPGFLVAGSFQIKWSTSRKAKSPIWLKIGYVVLMTHTNKKQKT